jgi:hypothetical protein
MPPRKDKGQSSAVRKGKDPFKSKGKVLPPGITPGRSRAQTSSILAYEKAVEEEEALIQEIADLESAIFIGDQLPTDEATLAQKKEALEEVSLRLAKLRKEANQSRSEGTTQQEPLPEEVSETSNSGPRGDTVVDELAQNTSSTSAAPEDYTMTDRDETATPGLDETATPGLDETATTGVDGLSIEWDISGSVQKSSNPYQHVPQKAYGHLITRSAVKYCNRYGSMNACSSLLETQPPHGDGSYQNTPDVTRGDGRIIQEIIQHHRGKKEFPPMDILCQAKILSIYWDSKTGIGHAANVDVLSPYGWGDGTRRPNIRCFTYLNPKLYERYNLENKTGYSHETWSTTKLWQKGGDREKCIALHNLAVKLENKFEEYYMQGHENRPGPLKAITEHDVEHQSSAPLRQTPRRSPRQRPAPQQTPPRMVTLEVSNPTSANQPKRGSSGGVELRDRRDRFHKDFLELFGLPDMTYKDLPEEYKVDYVAQFAQWKKAEKS